MQNTAEPEKKYVKQLWWAAYLIFFSPFFSSLSISGNIFWAVLVTRGNHSSKQHFGLCGEQNKSGQSLF